VFVECRHSIFIKELILKRYIKFEFKPNNKTRRRRGESLPDKPGGTGFGQCAYSIVQAPVHRFGLSRNLEKSSEYPGFTDKIVLSGDFQDSPIHPPLGDIKLLSIGI
jgi:hypothetical protein